MSKKIAIGLACAAGILSATCGGGGAAATPKATFENLKGVANGGNAGAFYDMLCAADKKKMDDGMKRFQEMVKQASAEERKNLPDIVNCTTGRECLIKVGEWEKKQGKGDWSTKYKNLTYVSDTTTGDTAVVKYEVQGEGGQKETREISLVKENNLWYLKLEGGGDEANNNPRPQPQPPNRDPDHGPPDRDPNDNTPHPPTPRPEPAVAGGTPKAVVLKIRDFIIAKNWGAFYDVLSSASKRQIQTGLDQLKKARAEDPNAVPDAPAGLENCATTREYFIKLMEFMSEQPKFEQELGKFRDAEIVNEKIEGNNATVTWKTAAGEESKETLVKENGRWYMVLEK